nr:GPW/gp25 family protein [uncultured Cellulosilyticum sp.]
MYEVTTTGAIDFYPTGIAEILQNVATIITTPKGSVPLDRNFGIDVSMLDLPLEIAENLLTVQIMEAIETYEERVEVMKVTYEKDHLIGKLQPKVQVNIIGT